MELVFKLVLWLHLTSIAIGGAASFGIPSLMSLSARAEPTQRPVFGMAIMRLAAVGRMAILFLALTGGAMVALRYGDLGAMNLWFWLKMLLVAGLIGLVLVNLWNGRRLRAGDAAAIARAPVLGRIGMGLLSAIVLTAVLAFP